jgi:hypothetical protein
MPGRTLWSAKLYFWDVPAALVGLALAVVLTKTPIGGYTFLWIGAPLVLVALRRTVLPQLTPPDDPSKPPPSIGRRFAAYACLVFGGFVALIAGGVLYVAATSEKDPQILWPMLFGVGFGGAVAALGVRWIT